MVRTRTLAIVTTALWPLVVQGLAAERPISMTSLHYPCLALRARVQGTIRVRCTIDNDGKCSGAEIVRGHPLFARAAVENAKKWRFAKLVGISASRTTDIDYQFQIRGVRNSETQPDVEVTFELPNRVFIIAPIDDKSPCSLPPACTPLQPSRIKPTP